MVSSYTTNKAFEKPANGDYVDTWNIPVNGDFDIADKAFGGTYSVALTNANVNLTQTNCQNVRIRFTGSLSANITIFFPAGVSGFFIVQNDTTGTYDVTLASAGGGAGTVLTEQGRTAFVFTDGTNVFYADDSRVALTAGTGIQITGTTNLTISLVTPVAVANGGTGVTTSTGTGSVVLNDSPALVGTPTAPTAAIGTDTTQIATTAFVRDILPAGIILLWSGSTASIPSGWLLCDGTNGTPDLRNRFVVGAGDAYAVAATGGADTVTLSSAQIPGHTHSFSATTSSDGTHTHTASTGSAGAHNHGMVAAGYPDTFNSSQYVPSNTVIGNFGSRSWTDGTHTHTVTVNSAGAHTHTVSGTTGSTGGGGSHENRPPYYALCYIMKS